METIKLVGGPMDGQVRGHSGGDWFYAVSIEPMALPLSNKADEPIKDEPLHHLVYRRSLVDPSRFEFQE